MDLKETFDRALDGGPAHRPIEERLTAGRRAIRHRRAAVGAGVLGVAVLGGAGWATLPPGHGGADRTSMATSLTDAAATTATDSPASPIREPLYGYDYFTGYLEMAPGVAIQRQLHHPIDRPGMKSTAAIVTYEGETWWVMSAARHEGSASWHEEQKATSTRSFEQWVHEMDVLNTEPMFDTFGYEAGWVTIGKDSELTAYKGARIVEQSSPARLDQAPEGMPSATATIEVDGARLCVIARILDEPAPDIVYLAESEYPGCGDAVIGYPYKSAP